MLLTKEVEITLNDRNIKYTVRSLQELEMEIKPRVEDYTQEELKRLSEKCLEIHYRYPLGVCLTNEFHNLFHSIYGYGDNTPEQFEEFKTRYYSNEFAKSG